MGSSPCLIEDQASTYFVVVVRNIGLIEGCIVHNALLIDIDSC